MVEILTNNMTAIHSKEMQKSFEVKSGIETPDFVSYIFHFDLNSTF